MSTSLLGLGNVGSAANIDQLIQAASAQPATAPSGGGFRKVLGGLVGAAANVFAPGLGSVIGNVIGGNSGASAIQQMSPAAMLQVQQQMAMEQETFTLASNVLKDRHDAAMSAIQNSKSS